MADSDAQRKRKSGKHLEQTYKRPKMTFGETIAVKAGPEEARRTFVIHKNLLHGRSQWLTYMCEWQPAINISDRHDVAVVEVYLNWIYDRSLDFRVIEALGDTSPQDGQGLMLDGSERAMFRRITGFAKVHALGNALYDTGFSDTIMDVLSDCELEKHCSILVHLQRKLMEISAARSYLSMSARLSKPTLWVTDVMSVNLTAEQLVAVLRDDAMPREVTAALMDSLVRLREVGVTKDGIEAFKAGNKSRYHI